MLKEAHKIWQQTGKFPTHAMAWPRETVIGSDGARIDRAIVAELPLENQKEALKEFVQITKAYGILLMEVRPGEFVARFESPHGSRVWRSVIERHGDVLVLGKTTTTENQDCLGLLWSSKTGTS